MNSFHTCLCSAVAKYQARAEVAVEIDDGFEVWGNRGNCHCYRICCDAANKFRGVSYTLKNRLIILSIVILIIDDTLMIPKTRVLNCKQKQPQRNKYNPYISDILFIQHGLCYHKRILYIEFIAKIHKPFQVFYTNRIPVFYFNWDQF